MSNSKHKINQLIHLVATLTGALALLGSSFLPPGWKEIVSSIGTALLAGSFVSFFDRRYLAGERPDLHKKWGLTDIYRLRAETDGDLNSRIENGAKQIDGIIQGGLHGLRFNMKDKLTERIGNGLILRILIPENTVPDEGIEKGNRELEIWYHGLDKNQKKNVNIRKYAGIPQDMYFRVDNALIIGPYLKGVDGPRNITYWFDADSKGGEIYNNYFDNLWDESAGGEIR